MTMPANLIGHVFNPDDPDTYPTYIGRLTPPEREEWCKATTEFHRIVESCKTCRRPLRRSEIVPHLLRHAKNGRVRSAAGTVLALPAEDAQAAFQLIAAIIPHVLNEGGN